MNDDGTRDPEAVLRVAAEPFDAEWAVWHPGDGTQYRVKLVPVIGGPNWGEAVLLVSVTGTVASLMFTRPAPPYRHKPWNQARWNRKRVNPDPSYDWWPAVIRPLLAAAGALS